MAFGERQLLEAARTLVRHPGRTLLAALTSAAAVAVVANVVSLAQGFDRDVRQDVARFGLRTLDLARAPVLGLPRGSAPLDERYVEAVRRAVGDRAEAVIPRRHRLRTLVDARGDGVERRLDGVTVIEAPGTIQRSVDVALAAGRWWTAEEERAGAPVAVVDAAVARRLLGGLFGPVPDDLDVAPLVGRRLVLGTAEAAPTAEVVGVLADPMRYRALFEEMDAGRSSRLLGSSILSFRNVYVPAVATSPDAPADLTGITVVARADADVAPLAEALEAVLGAVDPPQVRPALAVIVRRRWMEALGGTTQQGALVGNLIWILVAFVAAVLLATMNLVTVRERYDELAVRRVEGARRRDVAVQVTAESVATALLGGLLGLPIGALAARVLARLVQFPFRFDPRYAGLAIGVAVGIGALAALLPAWRAASIDPARVLARRMR